MSQPIPSEAGRAATVPLSVVIPVHNRSALLARALRGVAGQTLRPAEVVVVDDASADDSVDVARAFGATVIRHVVNRGAAAARNTGLRAATGQWVAMLDSDDEWLPGHLEALWSMRDAGVMVASSALTVREDPPDVCIGFQGNVSRRPLRLRSPAQIVWPRNFIPASGFIVRRETALAIGGYSETLRFAEDWDFLIRILDAGEGVVSPEITSIYHQHAGQKHLSSGSIRARDQILGWAHGRDWCTRRLLLRVHGARRWTSLAGAVHERRLRDAGRDALWLLRGPDRLQGGLGLGVWHRRAERRAALAEVPGTARAADGAGEPG